MELEPNPEMAGPDTTQPVQVLHLQSGDDLLHQSGLPSEPRPALSRLSLPRE